MVSPKVVIGERALNAAFAVDCPVPPRAIESCPAHENVRFCELMMPWILVSLVSAWTTFPLSRPAAKVPVHPRVRLLPAIEPVTFVSLVTLVTPPPEPAHQTGTADTVPVPVWHRNFWVAEVLPGTLVATPELSP